MQNWCSYDCAAAIGLQSLLKRDSLKAKQAKEAAKQEKAADRAKREAMKTLPTLKAEAQKAFNAFIRARDAGKPCICCGRYPGGDVFTGGSFDAGHYRSVGSAPHLRFNEDNVHAQLKKCNQYDGGRAVDYRLGLIARIGIERVEALEANQAPLKLTADELRALRTKYRAKARELDRALKEAP